MKQSKAKICGLVLHNSNDIILRDFSGEPVVTNEIAKGMIQIMEIAVNVQMVIVPDQQIIYDLVLGRNFLNQCHENSSRVSRTPKNEFDQYQTSQCK